MVFRVLLVLGLVLHAVMTGSQQKKSRYVGRLIMDPGPVRETPQNLGPDLSNLSLSPWTYKNTYDPDRVPQRLSHAQCTRSHCETVFGREDVTFRSKPIRYQVLVLRRVQMDPDHAVAKGGKRGKKEEGKRGEKKTEGKKKEGKKKKTKKKKGRYFFRLESEIITVGCTCVIHPTISGGLAESGRAE